jgi:hypothetical protein
MNNGDDWLNEIALVMLVQTVLIGYVVFLLVTGVWKVLSWPCRKWRSK